MSWINKKWIGALLLSAIALVGVFSLAGDDVYAEEDLGYMDASFDVSVTKTKKNVCLETNATDSGLVCVRYGDETATEPVTIKDTGGGHYTVNGSNSAGVFKDGEGYGVNFIISSGILSVGVSNLSFGGHMTFGTHVEKFSLGNAGTLRNEFAGKLGGEYDGGELGKITFSVGEVSYTKIRQFEVTALSANMCRASDSDPSTCGEDPTPLTGFPQTMYVYSHNDGESWCVTDDVRWTKGPKCGSGTSSQKIGASVEIRTVAMAGGNTRFSIINSRTGDKWVDVYVEKGISADDFLKRVKSAIDASGGTLKVQYGESGIGYISEYVFGAENSNATSITETEADLSGPETTCMNSGAANTLGWIVCPLTEWLSGQAQGLYDNTVKDALQVEPELFTGAGGGTQQGWNTFRRIANTLFIILLLVVIFSQLTGVGIDNYGIKKILPKLIIAAILINMSYWICVAFVDLSNILGNAFQAMFNGLAGNVTNTTNVYASNILASGGATIVSVVVISILLTRAAELGVLDSAVLMTLLVAALGVVISILFLFLLLSIRQAAIVILIVLSPLAVACNMLPNTKSLFDKWLKLFEALLLVYPICGLLIGGGNYVSKLLLASGFGDNGIFSAITAVVVGIIPIFFIPTVLRQSFSAMGQLGARISGMGQAARGAATRGMRNSDMYRNARERLQEGATRRRAGIGRDGQARDFGRVRTFMRGGNRGIERARAQAYQDQMAARNRARLSDTDRYNELVNAGAENQAVQDEMTRLAHNGDINNIAALQEGLQAALEGDGDAVGIRAYTDALATNGAAGRNAIAEAWALATRNANQGRGVSDAAARTFGNNILNNHDSFRTDARSLYDASAQAAAGNRYGGRFARAEDMQAGQLAMHATAGSMATMDDIEFARTFLGGAEYGALDENGNLVGNVDFGQGPGGLGLSDEQRNAIGQNAIRALEHSENLDPNRRAYLERIRDAAFPTGVQQPNS